MKNISIAIFCLISIGLSAQDYDFAIGVTFQSFSYKNYNKSDWNNMPRSYPDQPKIFNGYAIGLATDAPISDIFSIKAELLYSKQNQKHTSSTSTVQDTDGTIIEYLYNGVAKTEYGILKLPLLFSWNTEIGFKRGLYFSVFGGLQLSYLLDYEFVHNNYDWDLETDQVSDIINTLTIMTPNNLYYTIRDYSTDPISYREGNNETEYLYNRWLWGATGGVELRKNISSNFSISLGGRFEYDFTNSEKKSDLIDNYLILVEGDRSDTSTHNIRAGMSLNVMYLFD